MAIDHKGVPVTASRMVVWMAMRFRPLPALMFMLVVIVMIMQVGVLNRNMIMLECHRVP